MVSAKFTDIQYACIEQQILSFDAYQFALNNRILVEIMRADFMGNSIVG